MAGWRHAVELTMSGEDIGRLTDIGIPDVLILPRPSFS
jgi:hypothetical protein